MPSSKIAHGTAKSVAPGVTRMALPTPTLPPADHTNCWVLGQHRGTVVEPASASKQAQSMLLDHLENRGFVVDQIFLTHHHHDHIGGAVALQQATNAPIAAHPETASRLPFAVDILLDEGQTVPCDDNEWTTIHTPGHAPGHLCLLGASGSDSPVLILGDMIAGEGTILLDPTQGEGDLGQYLHSLQRLIDTRATILCPAHGPALHQGGDALRALIAHRHMRTGQIRQCLQEHPARLDGLMAHQIAPSVYPELPAPFLVLGERQVRCHLLWLAAQGEVTSVPEGPGEDRFFLVEPNTGNRSQVR